MHDTARQHGRRFFALYWQPHFRDVVEVGSQDVNGGLRELAPPGARYIGLDTEDGPGVDRLARPGEPLPLPDASTDVVLTSSAFEHDPCFWETFIDMARVLRPGGVLATFSCSGLMTPELFHKVVADAAVDAKRDIQVISRLQQAEDHPEGLCFPEGLYLKGLLCRAW